MEGGWGEHAGGPWRARERAGGRSRPFLPLLIATIQVVAATLATRAETGLPPSLAAYALLLIGPAALVLRHRRPLLTLGITVAASVTYTIFDLSRGPYFLAAAVALVGAVRRSRRELVWLTCGIGYAVFVVATITTWPIGPAATVARSPSEHLVVAVWSAVAVALAELARMRGEHIAAMARTRAESARARQEQARRQASEERLRIARELHDVLGHHLSLINVRAGVALHLLDSQPAQVGQALAAIKEASAEALREVRAVLATVHPDGESAPRAPTPGLSEVEALAAEAREAGLAVTVCQDGVPVVVPAEVDRAGYRIVQEALTNVRRHAGPHATAHITIHYGPDQLRLRVDDTGAGAVPPGTESAGNGIAGMRERAIALGGTLRAGPNPAGGFRVEASVPLRIGGADGGLDHLRPEPREGHDGT